MEKMLHFPQWQTLGVFVEGCHTDPSGQSEVALLVEKLAGSGNKAGERTFTSTLLLDEYSKRGRELQRSLEVVCILNIALNVLNDFHWLTDMKYFTQ